MTHLTVTGPDPEREPATGLDRLTPLKVYWEIASTQGVQMKDVGPVTYGQVPAGFVQIEPRNGAPSSELVETHVYNLRLSVDGGHGFNSYFMIRDGMVVSGSDR